MKDQTKKIIEEIIRSLKEKDGSLESSEFASFFNGNDKLRLNVRRILTDDLKYLALENNSVLRLTNDGWNFKSFEHLDKLNAKKERKEHLDFQISKWKYKTFWWLFFLAIFGGGYSAYDFISSFSEKEKTEPEITDNINIVEKIPIINEPEKVKQKLDCNVKRIVIIDSLIDNRVKLNDQNYTMFFANINPKCSNNVEYSEINNELIHKVLYTNPNKFVTFLGRISKKKEIMDYVLEQLENPVNDGIDLTVTSELMEKTKMEDSITYKLVLGSIKKAIEKYK